MTLLHMSSHLLFAFLFLSRQFRFRPLLPRSPLPPATVMLSVSLFCLPCLFLPALLLAAQFVYNKNILWVKDFVHRFFPAMKIAEEKAKKEAAEEAARKKAEFFAGGKSKPDAAATDKEGEDASTHGKRKDASNAEEVDKTAAAQPEEAEKADSKKGN